MECERLRFILSAHEAEFGEKTLDNKLIAFRGTADGNRSQKTDEKIFIKIN